MKIFYCCHTGSHMSLVAAAIHLGLLPSGRKPRPRELAGLPFFNNIMWKQIGTPFFTGEDSYGNKIYTLGLGYDPLVLEKAAQSFLHRIVGSDDFKLVNTIPLVNRYIYIGSYLSSCLGWDKVALPLITGGICKEYESIVRLAEKTKREAISRRCGVMADIIQFPGRKASK